MVEIGIGVTAETEEVMTHTRQQYSTRGRQEYRDRRKQNNGQRTDGGNRDRNERDFRRGDDGRDQRDERTIFTKSKEERHRAAERTTDDETAKLKLMATMKPSELSLTNRRRRR